MRQTIESTTPRSPSARTPYPVIGALLLGITCGGIGHVVAAREPRAVPVQEIQCADAQVPAGGNWHDAVRVIVQTEKLERVDVTATGNALVASEGMAHPNAWANIQHVGVQAVSVTAGRCLVLPSPTPLR